ncbi:hypothetical protein HN832_01515 [archaeon]|jgi:hypothetical protein|nr:hypothetical protein [archaeon]MBT4373938.1 hypothetical protein [archaeon]MBT4532331.1 hypothetical protein [archaeon]MBT7001917.1 hypothetical protein [archaeon]MBT7282070.1 hypothetical protein [archaeon]
MRNLNITIPGKVGRAVEKVFDYFPGVGYVRALDKESTRPIASLKNVIINSVTAVALGYVVFMGVPYVLRDGLTLIRYNQMLENGMPALAHEEVQEKRKVMHLDQLQEYSADELSKMRKQYEAQGETQ